MDVKPEIKRIEIPRTETFITFSTNEVTITSKEGKVVVPMREWQKGWEKARTCQEEFTYIDYTNQTLLSVTTQPLAVALGLEIQVSIHVQAAKPSDIFKEIDSFSLVKIPSM
jgi:hypothetical protein